MSSLARRLGIPAPEQAVARWHVAPWVDTLAYAFSWAPFLLPAAFLGDSQRRDYLVGYLVVLAFTDVHRHYGLPYVYLDRGVFRRHPVRFTVFPLAMLAAFIASPLLAQGRYDLAIAGVAALVATIVLLVQMLRLDRDPEIRPTRRVWLEAAGGALLLGGVGTGIGLATSTGPAWAWWAAAFGASALLGWRTRTWVAPALVALTAAIPFASDVTSVRVRNVLNLAAVFAGAWNIWHVYMQKYGILRMYAAKAGAEERVPGWVDRLLVFAWLPLYLLYLGTTYHRDVNRLFSRGRNILAPLFDTIEIVAPVGMLPAIGLVIGSIALFLYWENRAHDLRNTPRLVMAAGTTLLAASFLVVHPLKAYLAYALSHAIEYMVFVWAFQRRRYRAPLEHRPLIERFLRFPFLTYVVSAMLLGLLFTYWKYYGRWIDPPALMPEVFGFTTYELVGYWTVYQSMVHFYFDGFLWKMRSPATRATIGAS